MQFSRAKNFNFVTVISKYKINAITVFFVKCLKLSISDDIVEKTAGNVKQEPIKQRMHPITHKSKLSAYFRFHSFKPTASD